MMEGKYFEKKKKKNTVIWCKLIYFVHIYNEKRKGFNCTQDGSRILRRSQG